ncbi:Tetratricopeptide repeat-containing protein [Rheinheimera pacifica]|uniref:Tetratricopeptide repeat-containing protein n=1 Tax=Rheinheimera pacifica TaxID=173990 RepID=A0A1H6N6D9_9GAMM|nr:tetratricopeptide repeat protein [Rheinheimera pacifica]SEI05977.1 Tetratricopeptide repeat-containing protein [Rheinheimera pacifica]
MRSILFFSGLILSSSVLANSTDPQALTAQVKALWQAKDAQAAQALLTPLVTKKTKDAQLLALLGQTEALLNNADKAEDLLEKAVKIDSKNADYQHWYATVSCNLASSASMLSALGYAKRCKKAYETALKLAPDNPRSYIALGSFLAQAPGIAGGDKGKALQLAEQLKQIDALQGALLQLNASDLQDDAVFNALLAKDELLTQRPETYLQRGVAFSRTDEHTKAIALFDQALTMPASDDDAAAAQAQALYQIGRSAVKGGLAVDKGISALQQFIAQQPAADNIDWAKLRLGQLYIAQQQQAKAEEILKPLLASTQDKELKGELQKLL